MLAPVTVADLFKNGINLAAESFLNNGGLGDELTNAITDAFGPGAELDNQTLGQFIDLVRSGMEAATLLGERIPLKDLDAPRLPGSNGNGRATLYGSVERLSPADSLGNQEPGTSIPFVIPVDIFIEEGELDDIINSDLPDEIRENLSGSDRLRGNLQKYGHVRFKGQDDTYDIYIRQVFLGEPV